MGNIFDNRQSKQKSNLPFITGTANSLTNDIISAIDLELAKLFEDRNALLTQGGLITYLGDQVQFSEPLNLEFNSLIAGGNPAVIDLGSITRSISANGKMIYAVINREGTATVLASNLSPFDGLGAPSTDSLGNVITVAGTATQVSGGRFGNGLEITNPGGYLEIDIPSTVGTQDFTLECWVRPVTGLFFDSIIGFYDTATDKRADLYRDAPSQQLRWFNSQFAGGNISGATSTLLSDRWSHVAVSKSSGNVRIYLNGLQVGSIADTSNITADKLRVAVSNGGLTPPAGFGSRGKFDDVRLIIGAGIYTGASFTVPATPLSASVVAPTGSPYATVYDDADTLPAVTNPNQEVFLIAKRQDSADGLKRLYFRNGTALNEGQSVRLGASGTGGGDTNELLERLKTRLVNSPFEWVEPNIFFTDGEDKIDSATASFYLVKNLYQYTAAGQNIVSTQSLDSEFLQEETDLDSVELLAFWDVNFVDSNAIYEVSRNGGVDWVTISMERAGSSTETYRGILNFPQDTTYITLHQHTGFTTYKELDATLNQAIAQRFDIASNTAEVLQKLTLEISKTGNPSGYTYAQIVRDSGSGTPSTDPLDIVAQKEILNNTLSAGDNSVSLFIGTNTLKAGTYFLVVATDTAYKASYSSATHSVKLKTDATPPIGLYGINVQNLGVWGVATSETLIHSIQGRPLDLRVKITSSAGSVELKGYGLLYGRQQQVTSGLKNREVVSFDGTVDNLNEFTLSNFLPDRDLLKVYHVETGQTYVAGTNSFYLDGRKAIFPADTFNGLDTVTLVFDQTEGVSFDNSETNGALLAANFLGSTDALVDRSQAGRGIMLRSPDGSLYEITIQNGGAGFDIYLVT